MRSGTCIVGRVEEVVQGRRLEIARVIVFHRLEVKVGGLGNSAVTATESIAQNGARNVRAVPRMLVGG